MLQPATQPGLLRKLGRTPRQCLSPNTGVKRASIAMADVGATSVHAGLLTLRLQVLRVRTGAHSCSLDVLTKDIPITSSTLFGGDLGKVVVKAATTSRNYKALGDCFILLGLSRHRPPRSRNRKASASPPFSGDSRSRYGQGQCYQNRNRFRKRKRGARGARAPTNSLASPSSYSGSTRNRVTSPSRENYKRKKGSNTSVVVPAMRQMQAESERYWCWDPQPRHLSLPTFPFLPHRPQQLPRGSLPHGWHGGHCLSSRQISHRRTLTASGRRSQ